VTHREGEPDPHLELVVAGGRRGAAHLRHRRPPHGTGDLRVARAFLDELSERALSFVYEIPGSAFDRIVLLEPARLIQEQGWNQVS
jgi:hypothetical protein